MLKHVVMMKLREDVTDDEIEGIFKGIADLKKNLPGILSFSYGENTSNRGLNQGYTHAFAMDFVDEEYLENYMKHPQHGKVKAKIDKALSDQDGFLVFDYQLLA